MPPTRETIYPHLYQKPESDVKAEPEQTDDHSETTPILDEEKK